MPPQIPWFALHVPVSDPKLPFRIVGERAGAVSKFALSRISNQTLSKSGLASSLSGTLGFEPGLGFGFLRGV